MALLMVLETAFWLGLSMFLGLVGLNTPQTYRPVVLLSIVASALLGFRNISNEKLGFEGTETIAMYVMIYLSHVGSVLCVEKYTLPNKTMDMQWREAYYMLYNPRWLGTHLQAPDVPSSPKQEPDCITPPSSPELKALSISSRKQLKSFLRTPRGIFLRNRALSAVGILAACYLYEYAFATIPYHFGAQLEILDFLPSKQTYFRRLATVTLRETLIRSWIVTYWVFYSVGLYTSLHDILAFVFVATNFDKPEDWPPLFGSITEATSVRNFWGKYWHRLIYRSYTSYGKYISLHILRLPRNSIVGKFFINFFVFAVSGLAHAFSIRQLGFTCGAWEEVEYYCSNFLAIVVETAVVAAFKKMTGNYKVNSTVSKTIGYAWVFGVLFATVPKSQYPKLWCAPSA